VDHRSIDQRAGVVGGLADFMAAKPASSGLILLGEACADLGASM
jgi:hypothetical protein